VSRRVAPKRAARYVSRQGIRRVFSRGFLIVRSCGSQRFTLGPRQVGQDRQCRRIVTAIAVRVPVHRQRNRGMPRQLLRGLWMNPTGREIRYERVPEPVKIEYTARIIAVHDIRRVQVGPQHLHHVNRTRHREHRRGRGEIARECPQPLGKVRA
jgi:hypothetical protein